MSVTQVTSWCAAMAKGHKSKDWPDLNCRNIAVTLIDLPSQFSKRATAP
jgi:hypothetical protein